MRGVAPQSSRENGLTKQDGNSIFQQACLRFASALLLSALLLQAVHAQVPVLRGLSTTASGMLYYDHSTATDQKVRTYIYSIRPDSAGCISLDFNQIEMAETGDHEPITLITVYEGLDEKGKVLAEFKGSMQMQFPTAHITIVFKREGHAIPSIWTALWQAKSKAECISPKEEGPCAEVHDICGPRYHENFPHYGIDGPQALETVPGTCVARQHNSVWYRFMAQKDGLLAFDILPDNGFDDYDWVLLRGNAKNPAECPDLEQAERKLACNYAIGRGPRGSTGMGDRGDAHSAAASDSPYSQGVQAHKGDVFFLLIDDFSDHSSGFDIAFNEVVMACENPQKDLLHVDQGEPLGRPRIDPRSTFSQYTRVLRIDLEEKANLRLAEAALPIGLFESRPGAPGKAIGQLQELQACKGIAQLLIQGLKAGVVQGYSADDFQTPVHYGDLLALVAREAGDSSRSRSASWWNPDPAAFERFSQVVELIVDETFDKNSGRAHQEIRYLRLLWTDRDGSAPDYNVAVFKYSDVRDYADKIGCGGKYNDANTISMRDVLENQEYQGIVVGRSGKRIKDLQQARFEGDRQLELANYLWQK